MKPTISKLLSYCWNFDVSRFGKFISRTDSLCNISFSGLIDDIEQKTLSLSLPSKEYCSLFTTLLNADRNIFELSKLKDVLKNELELCDLKVQLPLKYDIDSEVSKECNISISHLQNNFTNVLLARGNLNIENLETTSLVSKSLEGSIFVKGLLKANIKFQTGSLGSIHGDKLLGNNTNIITQNGNIFFDSIYSTNNIFKTNAGNIQILNLQGSTIIQSFSGNVDIGLLDGDLDANIKEGSISCFANKFNKICINADQGDIDLKINGESVCAFNGIAKHIDINNNIEFHSQTDSTKNDIKTIIGKIGNKDKTEDSNIQIIAPNGSIRLKKQTWFESLNLKKQI